MRKCFRRSGSQLRSLISENALDENTKDVLELKRLAKSVKDERILAILPIDVTH
jgi:hypothetical protein